MSSDDHGIRQDRVEATAVITIDRERVRNAVTWAAFRALAQAFLDAEEDEEVRSIIVTGAGPHSFSAGGDLTELEGHIDRSVGGQVTAVAPIVDVMRSIQQCSKPVVAAINGTAVGAGLGLALLGDIRIAAAEARFGAAFSAVGLAPDFGITWTLPRIVGPGQASRLLFTSDLIDAEEARRIGLVDMVAAGDELRSEALDLCARINQRAPLGVRFAKAGLRRAYDVPYHEAVELEMLAQHITRAMPEHREEVASFLGDRPPRGPEPATADA